MEMSRQSYEAGDWSEKISEAMALGSRAKDRKRKEMAMNPGGVNPREEAGRELARTVVDWVKDWWSEGAF